MKKSDLLRLNNLNKFAAGTLKVRAKRKKETKPREQPEAEFRKEAIKHLRKKGCHVYRIENSLTGWRNSGIADLLVFNPVKGIGCFIELKSTTGRLSPVQRVFQGLCERCGIKYYVTRSVEEIERVICEAR